MDCTFDSQVRSCQLGDLPVVQHSEKLVNRQVYMVFRWSICSCCSMQKHTGCVCRLGGFRFIARSSSGELNVIETIGSAGQPQDGVFVFDVG